MSAIHRFVEQARRGELARVVARVPSGWAVLGDPQILPGYCLLLPDPVVPDLNALRGPARQQFLDDMARLGDAVLAVTGAERINYEMLGNVEPALHAHVIPRYLVGAAPNAAPAGVAARLERRRRPSIRPRTASCAAARSLLDAADQARRDRSRLRDIVHKSASKQTNSDRGLEFASTARHAVDRALSRPRVRARDRQSCDGIMQKGKQDDVLLTQPDGRSQ